MIGESNLELPLSNPASKNLGEDIRPMEEAPPVEAIQVRNSLESMKLERRKVENKLGMVRRLKNQKTEIISAHTSTLFPLKLIKQETFSVQQSFTS